SQVISKNLKSYSLSTEPSQIDLNKHHSAIIVGHPMGATKEQSANLYATKMAEQGFVALSFDLPFWGESEGQPRNAVEPELYAEAFSAAVDYLGIQSFVNRNAIGAIGICGSGSFVISAAKIDPRLKAIATISMYEQEIGFAILFQKNNVKKLSTKPSCNAEMKQKAEK
ncbi:alpha/beta hydrolase, partial [Zymomonas mobilis]|uniref:alpha/beta hydrolase n=1 Tax=Zymomonas mobilis TaxID=542 RepID=UPI0039EB1C47